MEIFQYLKMSSPQLVIIIQQNIVYSISCDSFHFKAKCICFYNLKSLLESQSENIIYHDFD